MKILINGILLISILFSGTCFACPPGYHLDNKYCVANSEKSRPIIEKVGNRCPSGWSISGSFCIKNGN